MPLREHLVLLVDPSLIRKSGHRRAGVGVLRMRQVRHTDERGRGREAVEAARERPFRQHDVHGSEDDVHERSGEVVDDD